MVSIIPHSYTYQTPAFKGQTKKAEARPSKDGTISVTNKKGDEYKIEYSGGRMKKVLKNGEFYKQYYYSKQKMPLSTYAFHTFNDGSKINESFFYSIGDTENTTVLLGDMYHSATIIKNPNPKYKNEPIVTVNHHSPGKEDEMITVRKADGEERFEFKSPDEAKEYFLNEYGIDAEFLNLNQAFYIKEAIDEVLKFNYKGKGKRYFEGMKILNEPLEDDRNIAYLKPSYWVDIPDGEVDPDDWDEILRRVKLLPDEGVVCTNAEIHINSNKDWNKLEESMLLSGALGNHSVNTVKGALIHELVHYMHLKESAKCFMLSKEKMTPDDTKIASEVSVYGSSYEGSNNYNEFVAEYATGRIAGKTYSKEADELYRKCGGPDLWGDESAVQLS